MTPSLPRFTSILVLVALTSACGDDDDTPTLDAAMADANVPDAGPSDGGNEDFGSDDGGAMSDAGCIGPPGLYVPGSCETLADGVRPFEPRYVLWADDAGKGRWVYLPPGELIDTSDPDEWIFPVGTRFYKEFGLGGQRLETRLLEKTGVEPGLSSWNVTTYVWDEAQRTATQTTTAVPDVLGTPHDVPSRAQCGTCHRDSVDTVLGFSAVQLAHDGAGVTLATLLSEGSLSAPIDPLEAQVPGDDVTRAALGYMHANCGGCHRGVRAPGELRLRVDVGLATPAETGAYAAFGNTALYAGGPATITAQIAPGIPAESLVLWRMEQRVETEQMPPIATEIVDTEGVAAVRAWIAAQPPL